MLRRLILLFAWTARQLERLFFIAKALLTERHFLYLACIAVAVSCAFAVIVLKSFAHNVFLLATSVNDYLKLPFANSLFPIAGILATVFVVRQVLGGKLEKGSSRVLYAVARRGGILPKKQMYAQILTSSLTVGMGGSAGLESPITITGAAIGSNFAQKYKLSQKDRILLLACGVAAGIGAAFNAPIAGVLFAIEVVLTDVAISAFIPIMISAATGAIVSKLVLGEGVLLHFSDIEAFSLPNVPFYVLLGLCAGLVSVFHARVFSRIEHRFVSSRAGVYKKAMFGAGMLGLLIFLFPQLFGEGYESVRVLSQDNASDLLKNTLLETFAGNSWVVLLFLFVTMLVKSIATGLTLGSGGNGGNFAPSLFVGSYLGYFIAKFFELIGFANLHVGNFTMVGMAGILSGLFHAPLTAIFLIGEITGGYELMIPLLIVSSISFAVSRQFEVHSLDAKPLAASGDALTSDKDSNILSRLDILALTDASARTFLPETSLKELTGVLAQSEQTHFPIVSESGIFIGNITPEVWRKVAFDAFRVKFSTLSDLQLMTDAIRLEDGAAPAMMAFEQSGAEVLAVVRGGTYFGLLSKQALLAAYRDKLRELVIE